VTAASAAVRDRRLACDGRRSLRRPRECAERAPAIDDDFIVVTPFATPIF